MLKQIICCIAALPVVVAQAAEPSGWRGDGTGKYAVDRPPLTWSRTSSAVAGLRFSAEKPADANAGSAMPDGVIREWLVLGPVPFVKHEGVDDEDALPDEAALAPVANQATAGQTWRRRTLDSAYLNFTDLVGPAKNSDVVAYAFASVYSPGPAALRLNLTSVGKTRLFLNGKKLPPMGDRVALDLAKGWNRLMLRISPGDKDWYAVPVLHGRGDCRYDQRNIAWRTVLPGAAPSFYNGGMGCGAPVVVGDRLYLLSEPHDLICLDKNSGKVLWIRRASAFEAAADAELKQPAGQDATALAGKIDAINTAVVTGRATAAQLQEKLKLESDLAKQMKKVDAEKYPLPTMPDVGYSGFTPATDGRFIYAFFGDGISACYTLDGERRWIRFDHQPPVEHGFSSSPLLVDGKLVVFMRDLLAFEKETGKLAWQTNIVSHEGLNPGSFFHGTPAAASVAGTPLIILGNGTIVRAGDGKIIYKDTKFDTQSVSSPVIEANRVVQPTSHTMQLSIRTLPEKLADPLSLAGKLLPLDLSAYPKHYLPWHLSSPLVHEGLIYLVNNAGVLTVIELESGKVCYQKMLDLDVFQAHNEGAARGIGISPVLAGKYIYFIGNNGAAIVIEAGPAFRQVARNKLESVSMLGHWSERQERFVANPIFSGNRLFLRGEESLYAIDPN